MFLYCNFIDLSYKGLLNINNPSKMSSKKTSISRPPSTTATVMHNKEMSTQIKPKRKHNKIDKSRDTLIEWLLDCIPYSILIRQ